MNLPPRTPVQWHLFPNLTYREQLEKEREWAVGRLAQIEPYKDVPALEHWLGKEIDACNDLIAYCDRVLAELPSGSPPELLDQWFNEFTAKEE